MLLLHGSSRGSIPLMGIMAKFVSKICSCCKTLTEGSITSGYYLAALNGAMFRVTRDEANIANAHLMLMGGPGSWNKVALNSEKIVCDNCMARFF